MGQDQKLHRVEEKATLAEAASTVRREGID